MRAGLCGGLCEGKVLKEEGLGLSWKGREYCLVAFFELSFLAKKWQNLNFLWKKQTAKPLHKSRRRANAGGITRMMMRCANSFQSMRLRCVRIVCSCTRIVVMTESDASAFIAATSISAVNVVAQRIQSLALRGADIA
jgi:hypothetical protein